MELTEPETALALYATEEALRRLTDDFPGAAVCLVHVPSPAATYQSDADSLSLQALRSPGAPFTPAAIHARSDALSERLREIAERNAVRFVDARPHLRRAARSALLHGPRDWRHLNRRGYMELAEEVLACLPERA